MKKAMSPRKEINIGLIIGMLYAVFINITGISIPCLFREITGLKCPGCGITTFFMNMFRGDIKAAISANPSLVIVLPLLGAVLVSVYVRNSWNIKEKWTLWCLYISLFLLLFFSILRNLPFLMDFCRKFIHI